MKKILYCILVLISMGIILMNPLLCYASAKNGLQLWLFTVIPTLFPFIFLSNIIILFNIDQEIASLFHPLTKRLFGISKPAAYPIIIGFLCGYPMGAKTTADLVRTKKISVDEGQYLLNFCNNASPMYIGGFIITSMLHNREHAWKLFIIMYLSPIITALLFRGYGHISNKTQRHNKSMPEDASRSCGGCINNPHFSFAKCNDCIQNAFSTVINLGSYIIICSVAAGYISVLPFKMFINIENHVKGVLIGMLEITNGISYIANSYIPDADMLILIGSVASFGGLSTLLQTQFVLNKTGLSVLKHLTGKVVCSLVSLIIGWIVFIVIG